MQLHKWIFILTCILLHLNSHSQAPANALGGYANVDNNVNKVPKVYLGITPLGVEFGQGISLRPGAHLKIRGDRFGEIQLSGTYTPDFLVKVPVKPFGPSFRCNCADNNFNAYSELDFSYTYYVTSPTKDKNYRILLKKPGISFSEKPNFRKPLSEQIPGQINRFIGIRLGAAYQKGSLFLLSNRRTIAYSGYEQLVAYVGVSRTSVGRMYRNFSDYGIKGKNIHSQFYLDAFYSPDQKFTATPVIILDSQGRPRKENSPAIPYGFRVGATAYNYGFRSKFALYTNIEAGIRPTFDDVMNGLYVNLKVGIGLGMGKTPVYYVSNQQNRINSRAPKVQGNGKYKERSTIGRSFYKRRPLKKIRHRYGK